MLLHKRACSNGVGTKKSTSSKTPTQDPKIYSSSYQTFVHKLKEKVPNLHIPSHLIEGLFLSQANGHSHQAGGDHRGLVNHDMADPLMGSWRVDPIPYMYGSPLTSFWHTSSSLPVSSLCTSLQLMLLGSCGVPPWLMFHPWLCDPMLL